MKDSIFLYHTSEFAQEVVRLLCIEDLDIEIMFDDDIADNGYCYIDPTNKQSNIDIVISENINRTEQLITIAHELIHACQFKEGFELDEQVAYFIEESLYLEALVNTHE
tara:strand:- start:101 stop:427 length:327 start_codon:yes stop_codon:yes gene_type:complete